MRLATWALPDSALVAHVCINKKEHTVSLLLDEHTAGIVIYAARPLCADYEAHKQELLEAADSSRRSHTVIRTAWNRRSDVTASRAGYGRSKEHTETSWTRNCGVCNKTPKGTLVNTGKALAGRRALC